MKRSMYVDNNPPAGQQSGDSDTGGGHGGCLPKCRTVHRLPTGGLQGAVWQGDETGKRIHHNTDTTTFISKPPAYIIERNF